MRRWLALTLTILCLSGGRPALAADPAWSGDEQAVAATDMAFYEATLAKRAQGWVDFADDNATSAADHGKLAIGAAFEKLYARPGFSLTWHPTFAKVVGDVGMTSGPYEMHLADAKGADHRSTGNYVTVWQRQSDGQWRFVWDGGTPDK
jgi:ketosteroid isomerase-like protein